MRSLTLAACLVALLGSAPALTASADPASAATPAKAALPALVAKDLSDTAVDLPARLSGTAGLLVVGFTMNSSDPCQSWVDHLWGELGDGRECKLYSVVQLQQAPGFIVPVIVRALKKKTAPERLGHVFVARQGLDDWQRALGYDAKNGSDDPYLVLVDASSRVLWTAHGAWTPARAASFEAARQKAAGKLP